MNATRLTCIAAVCRLLVLACSVSALMAVLATHAPAHSQDKDCADFATQRTAQDHQDTHVGDPDRLNDEDGVTCPELPCPCGATPLPPAAPIPARPPSAAPLAPLTTKAHVSRVVDGDTLKVRLPAGQMANVALIGVDSPEPGKPGSRGECGALEATAQMKRLVLRNARDRSVTLQTDPTRAREDQTDRLLAYVSARGVDLGRTMIASGSAKVDVFEPDFIRLTTYRKAQASAKAAKRGMWRCGGDSDVVLERREQQQRRGDPRHDATCPFPRDGSSRGNRCRTPLGLGRVLTGLQSKPMNP